MAIVWVDIWNSQNSMKVKLLQYRATHHYNLLQFKLLKVKVRKKTLYWVNIRELNKVSSTKLFILYTLDYMFILQFH